MGKLGLHLEKSDLILSLQAHQEGMGTRIKLPQSPIDIIFKSLSALTRV